ncbi:YitT family membrane protein [Secundilactobacillus pentosiphilus]|uniref:YitT family membrane protein n=1 Tax=Secundilactobacillus pentosiphilus TaxID=1714682 RepID=A0A1Z5ILY8_9LACO|nr:YitT family protein [Secundilactobacillus pentosiphilus]GAX02777.1 YitT family membrane protein [Secundilactobacillus pentosiphilus]GAX05500.1 YitT family membrane protein [Secundilactobacillus pentosiphilus]
MQAMQAIIDRKDFAIKCTVIIGAALINAIALNFFLIPGNIFSAGINGISQILSILALKWFQFHINTGWLILLFNIPIGILGWLKIGRGFTVYSFLTSFFTSVLAVVLPVQTLSHNALLSALFGGILTGAGVGYTLKYGFSTGGLDIIAVILEKTTGKTIGSLMIAINLVIVILAGTLVGWENAMYTVISLYGMSRVVDAIHTRHQKLTAFIVTTKPDEVIDDLNGTLIRGVTILPAQGAYKRRPGAMLMVVISRYELYELEHVVQTVDRNSFVNLVSTVDIEGNFYDETEQLKLKREEAQ